jgi:hypothetical protein
VHQGTAPGGGEHVFSSSIGEILQNGKSWGKPVGLVGKAAKKNTHTTITDYSIPASTKNRGSPVEDDFIKRSGPGFRVPDFMKK